MAGKVNDEGANTNGKGEKRMTIMIGEERETLQGSISINTKHLKTKTAERGALRGQ